MAKVTPLYDELIFREVLPELHTDFIDKNKEISPNVSPIKIKK